MMSLHTATKAGDLAEIQRLLVMGVEVNARDGGNCTPLHLACSYGHATCVAKLIAGAKVDARSDNNWTPLHLACLYRQAK